MDHPTSVLNSFCSNSKTTSKLKFKGTRAESVIYNVIDQRFWKKMKTEINVESDMGQTKCSIIIDPKTMSDCCKIFL